MRRRKTKGVIVRDGRGRGFLKNRGRDRGSNLDTRLGTRRGSHRDTRLRGQGTSRPKLEISRKIRDLVLNESSTSANTSSVLLSIAQK